jgi:post-segregation antitoxin (ccd killing protein)
MAGTHINQIRTAIAVAVGQELLGLLRDSGTESSAYTLEAIAEKVVDVILQSASAEGYELQPKGQN